MVLRNALRRYPASRVRCAWLVVSLTVAALLTPAFATAAATSDSPYTLQPPDVSWTENAWSWKLQSQYAWALAGGFVAGLLGVVWISLRLTAVKTVNLRELITGVARNPFLWLITGFAAAISGLIYSGAFEFIRSYTWDRLPSLYSWAPAGVLPIVLAWMSKRLTGRVANVRDALTGEPDVLTDMLESEKASKWVAVLILNEYHDTLQKRISTIAEHAGLGLIQRVVWTTFDAACDRGELSVGERDERTRALLELQPGSDQRTQFHHTRQGVQTALLVMEFDELEARLQAGERRSAGQGITVDVEAEDTRFAGGESAGRHQGPEQRRNLGWQPEARPKVTA